MKNSTPIEELNVEELKDIIELSKRDIKRKLEDKRKERVEELNDKSLYQISNGGSGYLPCIFDFSYILERLKTETIGDRHERRETVEESLKIRVEILEQISKMKEVPAFDTECHIESIYTNFVSWIRYLFFGGIAYRLVFHDNKTDYNKFYYKKQGKFSFLQKLVLLEAFMFLFSILLSNTILVTFDFVAILITLIFITLGYIGY